MKSHDYPTQLLRRARPASGDAGTPSEARVAEALEQYAASIDAGHPMSREDLLADYEEVAAELIGCLDSLDFIRQVAPQLNDGPDDAKNASAAIRPLATLGDFRIVRELGRGGMGVVYEAEQLSLGRRVALKVLPFASMLDKQQLARFKNEARAAATLDHPNIVAIHSVGSERGVHYYAMQLVEGQSLAEVVEQLRQDNEKSVVSGQLPVATRNAQPATDNGQLTTDTQPIAALSTIPAFDTREYFRTIAQLGIQAAEALDHAHQNGILHRDVKPANLMVDDAGKLWITDFGLARIEADAGMTMTGDIVGTLRYMSPEQVLAKRVVVDHRSDIYSLGVTLYELLALRPAFVNDDRQELLRQIAFEDPRKLRQVNSRIPLDLETIILKAIEKNPSDRFAIAKELADDLRRYLNDQPIKARPQRLIATARKWSRRHRGLLVATAATVLVSGIVLAGSVGWIVRDRQTRQSVAEALTGSTLDEATRLVEQQNWPEALIAIRRAEDVFATGSNSDAASARANELRNDVEMVLRLEEIRSSSETETEYNGFTVFDRQFDRKYVQAFREYGIEVDSIEPAAAAGRIKESRVRLELTAAIDHWAYLQKRHKFEDGKWKQLVRVARLADADPWRNRLRKTHAMENEQRKAGVVDLAESIDAKVTAQSVELLSDLLRDVGALDKAEGVLLAARRRHPHHFGTNYKLFECYGATTPPQPQEQLRYSTALQSLRPESAVAHYSHASALAANGMMDEAIVSFREAMRLRPDFVFIYGDLGNALWDMGRRREAIEIFRVAVRYQSKTTAIHAVITKLLSNEGLLDEAIASFYEAVRLAPEQRIAHTDLAKALLLAGRYDEALPILERAHQDWHRDFEIFQFHPDDERAESAFVAMQQELRRLVRDDPEVTALVHLAGSQLKGPFRHLSDDQEALELLQRAHKLSGDEDPIVCGDYGWALYRLGRYEEALAWLKKTDVRYGKLQSYPRFWVGGLVLVHLKLGNREAAEAIYQQAMQTARARKRLSREEVSVYRETAAAMGDVATMEEVIRERWPQVKTLPISRAARDRPPSTSVP